MTGHSTPQTRRSPNILRHAAVLVAVFGCLLAWAWWTSQDATGSSGQRVRGPANITVIGDSITALYDNEPGGERQGWWSMVGYEYDSYVRTFAQSGSGYLRPGLACTGTRFNQRLHALSTHHADMVIVEGGRNDWAQCVDGRFVRAPDDTIRRAVFNYLSDVNRLVSPSTRVLVLGPPWGPLNIDEQERISSIIRAAALHYDMQFVPMDDVLNATRVVDGVHPNRAGSQAIADQVIQAINQAAPTSDS